MYVWRYIILCACTTSCGTVALMVKKYTTRATVSHFVSLADFRKKTKTVKMTIQWTFLSSLIPNGSVVSEIKIWKVYRRWRRTQSDYNTSHDPLIRWPKKQKDNNGRQHTTQKTKHWTTRTQLKWYHVLWNGRQSSSISDTSRVNIV